jgi:L-lysine 2,3-aminomutase
MQKGDINDPLLRQVLPLEQEWQNPPHFSDDPLAEKEYNPLPGLLHKYRSRVLLTVASACAINCRYCFRRVFDYSHNHPGRQGWQQVLAYIRNNKQINELKNKLNIETF